MTVNALSRNKAIGSWCLPPDLNIFCPSCSDARRIILHHPCCWVNLGHGKGLWHLGWMVRRGQQQSTCCYLSVLWLWTFLEEWTVLSCPTCCLSSEPPKEKWERGWWSKGFEFGLTQAANFENASQAFPVSQPQFSVWPGTMWLNWKRPTNPPRGGNTVCCQKGLKVCSVEKDASWDSSAGNRLGNKVTDEYRCNHTSPYILDCTMDGFIRNTWHFLNDWKA